MTVALFGCPPRQSSADGFLTIEENVRRQKRTWHDVAGDHGKLMVRPQNHKDHKGRRTNTTPCGATWAEQRDIHPKSPTLLLDRAFCYWFPFFESSRPQTNTIPISWMPKRYDLMSNMISAGICQDPMPPCRSKGAC